MCCWDDFFTGLVFGNSRHFYGAFLLSLSVCLSPSLKPESVPHKERLQGVEPHCTSPPGVSVFSGVFSPNQFLSIRLTITTTLYFVLGGGSRDHPPQEIFPDKMLETNTESLDSWTIQETRKEPSTGKGNKGLEGWGRAGDGWWEEERGTSRRGG